VEDKELEKQLAGFRPRRPRPELRKLALYKAQAVWRRPSRRSVLRPLLRRPALYYAAAAAVLVATIMSLSAINARIDRSIADALNGKAAAFAGTPEEDRELMALFAEYGLDYSTYRRLASLARQERDVRVSLAARLREQRECIAELLGLGG